MPIAAVLSELTMFCFLLLLLLLLLPTGITGGVISHSGFESRFFGHVSTLLLLLICLCSAQLLKMRPRRCNLVSCCPLQAAA
jgi:hypothetical protein